MNSTLKVRAGQLGLFMAGGVATAAIGLGTAVATSSTPGTHHDTTTAAASIVDSSRPDSKLFQRTELYFGTEKPDGTEVTATEFAEFVNKTITPAFPDGLTELDGHGQWKNDDGTIEKETSHEVILLYPITDRTASGKIEKIRTAYKNQFQQESVLRDDSTDRVSF